MEWPINETIKAVIFDNDGLLQDTEKHYEEAFTRIARQFGKAVPRWLLDAVKGIDIRDVMEVMIGELELPITHEDYKEELDHLLIKLAPTAKMMPGAEKLVRALSRKWIQQAVATSSVAAVLKSKMSKHQAIYGLFNKIVAGDDPELKRSKPEPDIFLLAAKRLEVDPATCVVFGDTPADVQAAHAAGMYIIGVSQTEGGREKLKDAGADHIFSSLEEFSL